ncbi:MAG: HMA2 domain-containing protein [Pseudomonadota bacterium]
MVDCVHHIPGRARFKIEALRRDPELVALIERQVGSLDQVQAVEINRHAASIVVHYCTERGAMNEIFDHICAHCSKNQAVSRAPSVSASAPEPAVAARSPRRQVAAAMRDAAGKALLKAFIERAMQGGLAGGLRI